MAAVQGHHVPGTPYHWEHGYKPLDAETARKNRHKWAGGSSHRDAHVEHAATPTASTPRTAAPVRDTKGFLGRYDTWRSNLTPAQDKAVRFYQSPGYALMNGQLRGLEKTNIKADVSFNDADLKRARAANTALKQAINDAPPIDHDITVYRGFDANQFGDLTVGKTVTDKGFTSTSLTDDAGAVGKAGSKGQATIVLPKGTKAAAGSTRELILPPGSTFRVTKVTKRGGTTYVEMEYVLPGSRETSAAMDAAIRSAAGRRRR
jgi:hypothetical protein